MGIFAGCLIALFRFFKLGFAMGANSISFELYAVAVCAANIGFINGNGVSCTNRSEGVLHGRNVFGLWISGQNGICVARLGNCFDGTVISVGKCDNQQVSNNSKPEAYKKLFAVGISFICCCRLEVFCNVIIKNNYHNKKRNVKKIIFYFSFTKSVIADTCMQTFF